MPTIAIIAQGMMGAGLARRLTRNGATVLTSLEGRGAASAARAEAAGMRAVPLASLGGADIVLSVLPPAEALALAERLVPVLRPGMVHADCNAISPALAERIGAALAPSGCAHVDGGIIGGPPRDDGDTPKLHASGPHAAQLAALEAFGLKVPVLDGPVGAASALRRVLAATP